MEENPTRICELIVGLGDVEVLGVDDEAPGTLAVHIRTRRRPACGGCGGSVWSKGSAPVSLVDLAAFGRPVRLVWHKWRWCCPAASCPVGSFTEIDEQIAPARSALTARAGRWATIAVGRDARPVADVAGELGCDWHTVNRAVLAWGEALLAADCDRVGAVEALGLDETLFGRQGPWRARRWCTSIVDVTGASCSTLSQVATLRVPPRGCWINPRRGARHRLGCAGPVGGVPARLRRGAAPRRPGRRPVSRDPPREQQHRRGAPAHSERHLGSPRPQGRPPLAGAATTHFCSRAAQRRCRRQAPRPATSRVLLVDETSMRRRHRYVTVIVSGDTGELLAMVPHRSAEALSRFFAAQGHRWCAGVKVVVTDGSKAYRAAVDRHLGHATHVLDRFHVIGWFAAGLVAVRRDVQRRQPAGVTPVFDAEVFRARFLLLRRSPRRGPPGVARQRDPPRPLRHRLPAARRRLPRRTL